MTTRAQTRDAVLRVAYDRGKAHGLAGKPKATEQNNAEHLARSFALVAGITWKRTIVLEHVVTRRYEEGYTAGKTAHANL